MEINGIDHVCLRDSGSSIDVCSRSWINENDLLSEYVWLKSPLDEICHCLPLAKIKIKTKKGEFYTKAAIKQDSSDNNLYLLGNRTAELLESNEQQGVQLVNAVVTRNAVGPLPVSTKQNRYLITSICVASKYPEAIPVESSTSPNVIDALLSIFSRIGFPREIQSDLGTSFTSELTTTFFNKFGIKVTRSSVNHPQSNAVERVHRTIKRVIKALCVELGEDMEGVLPLALFSLRTVAHESTGFSPTELVMGKNLRTLQTLVYEEWMEEGNTSQSIGPGKVLSRTSDTNYVIDLPGRRDRSTIYHVNLLKPYHRRLELVSLVVEEISDDIEGDAEIPYPDKQCTKFHYHEILRESQLQLKLSPSQIDELKQVITKNKDVFSPDPGMTHLMRMDIELISDKPVKTKPYRMSPRQINILREKIKLESPNKDPRPCVDYRRLNEITRAEFFPLPNMEEIEEKVSAALYVTVMDLSKGYFQIPLTPRAQRYAAFVTPFGTYIPKKIMFGLWGTTLIISTIASPLTDALKGKIKKEKITWDEKYEKAFEELKAKLVSQPISFSPDFATDFILQTDASEEKKRKRKREREKGEKSSEKTRAGLFRKRRGESQSFLFGDADQESKTRMRKNALRTGRRQAVDAVLPPDASALTDEDKADKNEVSSGEIIVKDVPRYLRVRSGDRFQPEPSTSSSCSTTKSRKKQQDIFHFG
ncbi:retrovirus-related Pol polyprotein from transposon 17.6 [Trichonephila clavipes]|nr:retrovirus-related Pol polyprotein from transposon 17.6 [Trichonephila clavipes]